MTDDGAISGGTGLEALVEAAKDGPAVTDSSEAPSAPETAATAKKSPAKPKQPSPYLGWQKWTL